MDPGRGVVPERMSGAAKNPKDPGAQIGYANALQAAGQTATAVAVLQKYTTANPKDADALRQLAALWGAQATKARKRSRWRQGSIPPAWRGRRPGRRRRRPARQPRRGS